MRQVGLLAAAADFALDHVWPLMEHDHRRAKAFAVAINESKSFEVDVDTVASNIVLFKVLDGNIGGVLKAFGDRGVGLTQFGPDIIRTTFHYQITDDDLDHITAIIREVFP
jgi:threonine aldolase